MASITKRGKGWFVQVRRRGTVKCATFPTKRQADAWAVEIEAEILAGPTAALEKATLGDAFTRYALEVSPGKRGCRWEVVRLESWHRWPLAKWKVATVDAAALATWRDARLKEVSPGTVAREMNLLGSVLDVARREWGMIKVNPLRDVSKPPRPRARRRIYSDDEVLRVVAALGYAEDAPIASGRQVVAALFLVALETAMRLGEMVGLEWPDVNLKTGVAVLSLTKNGDDREVPLSPHALDLLGRLRHFNKPFPISRDTASVLFARATKAAGIDKATFHDSRATAVTRLAKRLDVMTLARVIGHRDLKSLLVYYRESAADIAKRL